MMVRVQHDTPPPQLVRYNDWRQVAVAAPGAFVPERPVSVVVPYYAQPEELGRTLAALEGQTYPRELFEVVVVDDGSPEALERPGSTPLDVKVVRQEGLGFGAGAGAQHGSARGGARHLVVSRRRPAAGGGLVGGACALASCGAAGRGDGGLVVARAGGWSGRRDDPEPARDAERVCSRDGRWAMADFRWFASRLFKTGDLTSKADDPFQPMVLSGNMRSPPRDSTSW